MSDNVRKQNRFVGNEAPFIVHSSTRQGNRGGDALFIVDSSTQVIQVALETTFEEIKSFLEQELDENNNYSAVWKEASKKYDSGKFPEDPAREFYQAIMTYTYENGDIQIYSDFKSKSRQLTVSSWIEFPYKSLYCLLAQSIKKGVENAPDAIGKEIKIFRGLSSHFDCNENDHIIFNYFSSFSCSESIANQFAGQNGTVFEIEPPMKEDTALGIKNYSFFVDEEEVLVMPWSTFLVKNVTAVKNVRKVVLKSIVNKKVKI